MNKTEKFMDAFYVQKTDHYNYKVYAKYLNPE